MVIDDRLRSRSRSRRDNKFAGSVSPLDDRSARFWRARQAMVELKGCHFEPEATLWAVRWYVEYPTEYRQLQDMMAERGMKVDPDFVTAERWARRPFRNAAQSSSGSRPPSCVATLS